MTLNETNWLRLYLNRISGHFDSTICIGDGKNIRHFSQWISGRVYFINIQVGYKTQSYLQSRSKSSYYAVHVVFHWITHKHIFYVITKYFVIQENILKINYGVHWVKCNIFYFKKFRRKFQVLLILMISNWIISL